jgi:DUF1365 family protein
MKSFIYEGCVEHRRHEPIDHSFRFNLFWMYLDLAELPRLFERRWFWSCGRINLASFLRADYLGDPGLPIDTAVRDRVESDTGERPAGPIRMLTHLRYGGHIFNPVTFYYCFDAEDRRVETVVTDITNTPWGERHSYVLTRREAVADGDMLRFRFPKRFHVSPFNPLEQEYDWAFSAPQKSLRVEMNNLGRDGKVFDARMGLRRVPITTGSLARVLLVYPLLTVRIIATIYWQALRLKWRGAPAYPHPTSAPEATREAIK